MRGPLSGGSSLSLQHSAPPTRSASGEANVDHGRLQQFAVRQFTEEGAGEAPELLTVNRDLPFQLVAALCQTRQGSGSIEGVRHGKTVLTPLDRHSRGLESDRKVPGAEGFQVSPLVLQGGGQILKPLLDSDLQGSGGGRES